MKEIETYRDPSCQKLRRHLRHTYGRSVRLSGLAG